MHSAAPPEPVTPTTPAQARVRLALAAAFYLAAMGWWIVEGVRGTVPVDARWAIYAFIIVVYGALSLVALRRRPENPQVRVFTAAGICIALTIVAPLPDLEMRPRALLYLLLPLSSLVYTLPVAVFVHLASVIPRPHPLFQRHRRLLPAAYGVAGAMALLSAVPYMNALTPFLPWEWSLEAVYRYDAKLNYAGNLLAGVTCLGLLGHAALRDASPVGRRQALAVLLGLVPWTFRQGRKLFWVLPPEVERLLSLMSPFTMVVAAGGFFVAIAGFQLFRLGPFLRKSVIYGVTTGVLASAAYAVLVLARDWAALEWGVRLPFWLQVAGLVPLGIAFQPLAGRVGRMVDGVFFREKRALAALQRTIIPELAELTGLDEAAAHLAWRLRDALGAANASLVVADERGRFYRVRALAGEVADPAAAHDAVARREELDLLWPSGPRHPRAAEDAPPGIAPFLASLEARWVVPVEFRGELIGVLTLGGLESAADFDRDDLAALEVLALEVSAMLENARLFGMATRDHLTGLAQRRVFEERLALELERARRYFRPFAVGMADVDDFKRVNDRFGHPEGDRVLRRVGGVLAAEARGLDVLARWGGEEFSLLLPETDAEGARACAERLRAGVEAACARPGGPAVTLSVGVYVLAPEDVDLSPAELVARADHALYAAKAAGKNRVVLHGAEAVV